MVIFTSSGLPRSSRCTNSSLFKLVWPSLSPLIRRPDTCLSPSAQALSGLTPETLRDSLRARFPYPCRSRYTAISMVPQAPPLMARLTSALGQAVTSFSAALGWGSSTRSRRTAEEVEEDVVERSGSAKRMRSDEESDGPASPAAAVAASTKRLHVHDEHQFQHQQSHGSPVGGISPRLQRGGPCSVCSDGRLHGRGGSGGSSYLLPGTTTLVALGAGAAAMAVVVAGLRAYHASNSRA